MSMMRCETHDRMWDSDYHESCPACDISGLIHCWMCCKGSTYDEVAATSFKGTCPFCGYDYPKLDYEEFVEAYKLEEDSNGK